MCKRFILVASALTMALGCQRTDPSVNEKLDQIEAKLETLSKKADSMGGGRPMPQRPEPRGADPSTVYAVPIGNAAVKGPATAKVTIVEAAEFACPFCRMAEPTLEEIAKAYPNDVRFVFKHFVVHPQVATLPALATCAAQKQGKFWEMKHAIWESAWSLENGRPRMKDAGLLGQENLEKLAKDVGLDASKFKSDMESEECKSRITADQRELSTVGVDGTPAFFVNGRPISGAQPFQNFKAVIDEEMKKADEAIKSGVKADEYYEKVVVGKGKKTT